MLRSLLTLLAALALIPSPWVVPSHGFAAALPTALDSYLTTIVKLSPEERKRFSDGAPVTKLLETNEDEEVAVFGAIWIGAPMQRYVDAVKDIENFERGGGFRVTRRISSPPRIEDFAEMRLPDEDFEDLKDCRVGDCIVKLGEEGIRKLRAEVDFRSPGAHEAANALMRQFALEYVTRYLAGGNESLAVYRDHSRPLFVAKEFRAMIDRMPALTTYMPNVRRYLLDYPKAVLEGSTSFLYWQETEFGLRPTTRISHVVIREGPNDTVVATKMLYASHYFWTGLEGRVLLPDPARGPGFWFITVSRSRSDGLTGFTGRIIRSKVRGEVEEGTLAGLQATKKRLEQTR